MHRVIFIPRNTTWREVTDRYVAGFVRHVLPEWVSPVFQIARDPFHGGFTIESKNYKMMAILNNRVSAATFTHVRFKKSQMEVEFQPAMWEQKTILPAKPKPPEVTLPACCTPFRLLMQECHHSKGTGMVFSYFSELPECKIS